MDKNHFEINELYQRAEKFRADFDQKWYESGIDAMITPS